MQKTTDKNNQHISLSFKETWDQVKIKLKVHVAKVSLKITKNNNNNENK